MRPKCGAIRTPPHRWLVPVLLAPALLCCERHHQPTRDAGRADGVDEAASGRSAVGGAAAGKTAALGSPQQPQPRTMRAGEVPDLTQTDPQLDLPQGGEQYCAAVAVANSLLWLAGQGFPRLAPAAASDTEQARPLVQLLGSRAYMDTSPDRGTGTHGVLRGVSRYLAARGYRYRRLEYQGWRYHQRRFNTGVRVPELGWLRRGIEPLGAAWLNVGWYRARGRDRYLRLGGHWVTVVAVGVDEQGREDPTLLVLHDPAPEAGSGFANEYVRAERIERGWLVEGSPIVRFSAAGFHRLGGGMHIRPGADVAIMDGAVLLVMG